MYSFDIEKFIHRQLPPFLRTPIQRYWIKALLSGTQYLLDALNVYRSEKLNELSYTGQTIQLERYLNDVFDPAERRIKIVHFGDNPDFDYLISENGSIIDYDYLASENQPLFYIYLYGESAGALDTDFKVLFPSSLDFIEQEVRSRVDRYRVAGKQYVVQFV